MPEGHTLYRLAADLREAFLDRPVHATSPQGRFVEEAALIDGHPLSDVGVGRQASVPDASTTTWSCTSTSA